MTNPGASEPTVIELAESVRRGERKAVEVVDEYLGRLAEGNEQLNAFVHIDADLAHAAASAVDEAVARGEDPGPLAGVPFGVKDLEHCVGMPTTMGSLPFAGRGPESEDSLNVARLRAAGAIPVGKTASPEFGTLNFTKTKVFGVTRNPWDVTKTPGGSSGGSSAAVAAGIIPFATASDGGGSIRIPASFAGLVGHKSSHGRIPHPEPTANQTSVSGSLTTTVADTARILDVLAGPDDRDRTSLPPSGIRYEDAIESTDVRGLRARWSLDYGFAVVDPEVAEISEAAARALAAAAGLVLDEEPIVLTDPVRAWLTTGAISLWLDIEPEMWPARADDFTLYVRRSLEQTEGTTLQKYTRSIRAREQLEYDCARIFQDVDIVLSPTTAVPAFAAEGPPPSVIAGVEMKTPAMATPFTMLANLCWNPATSVPAGLTSDGLPVGLQIMGRRHLDEVPLRLARIFEQTQPWPRFANSRQ
ncbi:MAG: aspartyl-tRNA(Asn)/glutamyl-tRNA(Gln) amidotransferase subunit [Acidimicrobiaceae bacterium]|jgi:aspartyl-tRNA(Asn)/glutamyl-tRNA(Gln) amidotransferase subunit A